MNPLALSLAPLSGAARLAISSKNEPKPSFEHFLGAGTQMVAPKKPAVEIAAPGKVDGQNKPVPEEGEEAKDGDPNETAALAAMTAAQPPTLPPPPGAEKRHPGGASSG